MAGPMSTGMSSCRCTSRSSASTAIRNRSSTDTGSITRSSRPTPRSLTGSMRRPPGNASTGIRPRRSGSGADAPRPDHAIGAGAGRTHRRGPADRLRAIHRPRLLPPGGRPACRRPRIHGPGAVELPGGGRAAAAASDPAGPVQRPLDAAHIDRRGRLDLVAGEHPGRRGAQPSCRASFSGPRSCPSPT